MAQMQELLAKSFRDFREGSIVKGRILEIRPREVLVDIGYKSEGVIPSAEFDDIDTLEVGDEVDVLLERLENDEGMVVLSKEKAAYRQNWNKIVRVFQGDGLIKGKVKSVVKGGLMVNIGVEAFLPASQIDIVPPKDLQQFVGNTYDFKIVKINDDRRNVVLSRREIIEQERSEKRQKFLEGVNIGDRVDGTVKNLTDFGAFIDLDGMDGLLHITDMTWGRLGHPERDGQGRSAARSRRPRYQQGKGARFARPKADAKESVGPDRRTLPGRTEGQGQDHQSRSLRRVRRARGRRRRSDPRFGAVLDETNHAAIRHSKCRSGSRSGCSGRKQGRAKNFPRFAPARTQSVGRDREEVRDRQPGQRTDSQHDRLRRVRGTGRRHRRDDSRLRFELDPKDQSSERSI